MLRGQLSAASDALAKLPLESLRAVSQFLDARSLVQVSMVSSQHQSTEFLAMLNEVAAAQLEEHFSEEWNEVMSARIRDAKNGSAHVRTLGAQPQLVMIASYARTKLGLSPERFHAGLDRLGRSRLLYVVTLFSSNLIKFADGVDDSDGSVGGYESKHVTMGTDPTASWGDWEFERIHRASSLDNPVAHREQAIRTFTSQSVPKNKKASASKFCRGIMWLQRAAPYDHLAKSLLASGLSFPDEFDVPELRKHLDPDLVAALYKDAAAFGLLDAQVNLGMIHTGKFAPFPAQERARFQDHAKSFSWWRKAADCAQPEAMINLGHMYAQGTAPECHGTPAEDAAFRIWERLAATGDLRGSFLVAICYANGRGVGQDLDRARALLKSIPRFAPESRLASEASAMLRSIFQPPSFANPQAAS
ncbi:Protein sel-1-like 1 [Hondaea fermentalgiana]|uniref:Protein sel-1-like 1 n=1 Tax=Hondaea fermentalgiana TaxID=2315210 RepID=A0A2R5G608_9STRA|nr:Protein sel-1-like 1 [Hondaea fermentalgiana]|eukprot:GBG26476.1 Protein sel-1-like 1 [Hondaea fermentalgiana]